jgi:hypothetical protein
VNLQKARATNSSCLVSSNLGLQLTQLMDTQSTRSFVMRTIGIAVFTTTLFAASRVGAQAPSRSPDGLWREVSVDGVTLLSVVPSTSAGRASMLDLALLRRRLGLIPRESEALPERDTVTITLPLPKSARAPYARFRISDSPITEHGLENEFGASRTYRIRGTEDPTMTGRLETSAEGITGIILIPGATYIIEPVSRSADEALHVTYLKPRAPALVEPARRSPRMSTAEVDAPARPVCRVTAEMMRRSEKRRQARRAAQGLDINALRAPTPARRIYRLAVVATQSYAQFHREENDTDVTARHRVVAAIRQTVNLVQALYERELGIEFRLVDRLPELVFLGDNRGYTTELDQQLDRNVVVLDSVLGTAGYDIGHVFSTSGGGLAEVGSVCDPNTRARGATGLPSPTAGKYFAIDYVAHELGHQFGGTHTFNGSSKYCNGNRYEPTAFEPGSGSTVMAYAGNCAPEDVQAESDEYFHAASLEQIFDHLDATNCARVIPSNNRPPTITARDFVIPSATPFVLSATGTDPDNDVLTYTFEEYYPQPWAPVSAPPNTDSGGKLRPIIRSVGPTSSAERVLPGRAILFDRGTGYEVLPTMARGIGGRPALTFRVTARDTRGAAAFQDIAVSVVTSTTINQPIGPFIVTKPARAAVVRPGALMSVAWNVARTNATPLSCGRVRIDLSIDNGANFGLELLENTANDGSENVGIPANTSSNAAWIRVTCRSQPFFNVTGPFRIVP